MDSSIWQERRKQESQRDNDVRDEYERDYARLIHSAAFRRLQAKTQVLGLGESDFYRTRLTHSMEVAQIGVGIVRRLEKHHSASPEIIEALPDRALMSSICLAHDIGHPPFGHGGEVALNLCMRDFGGFEGNGQTLRILSRLAKYTADHGLNPTRRLLLGVLKYPAPYSQTVIASDYGDLEDPLWMSRAVKQHPPKCFMDEEQDVVDWILKPLDVVEREEFTKTEKRQSKHRKPLHQGLDTSIMELADDISYSLHDLEDALSLGMITRAAWDHHNADFESLFDDCGQNLGDLSEELFSEESYRRKGAIGHLVNLFITNIYVGQSSLSVATNPLIKWNAQMGASYKSLLDHIFDLVLNRVIKSTNVQQLEFKGQKLIVELFTALQSDPERLLPQTTLAKWLPSASESGRVRVICDYISGMTDEYATRLYEKIYHPHKGSIFDRL